MTARFYRSRCSWHAWFQTPQCTREVCSGTQRPGPNGVEFQTNLRIHLLARSRLSIEGRTEGASKLNPASRRLLSYGSVSCGPILGLCIRNPMLWGFHFKYRSIVAAKSRTRRCRP
jgi:hypothetical protein